MPRYVLSFSYNQMGTITIDERSKAKAIDKIEKHLDYHGLEKLEFESTGREILVQHEWTEK